MMRRIAASAPALRQVGGALFLTGVVAFAMTFAGARDCSAQGSAASAEGATWRTRSGIQVFSQRVGDIPRVVVRASLLMTSELEHGTPAARAALAALLLARGGTGELGPEEFETRLSDLGIQLGSTFEDGRAILTLEAGTSEWEEGLDLMMEVLAHPRFDETWVAQYRQSFGRHVVQEESNPFSAAVTALGELLQWGELRPQSRATRDSVLAITRDELVAEARRSIRPERLAIGVFGNVSRKEVENVLRKHDEKWTSLSASATSPKALSANAAYEPDPPRPASLTWSPGEGPTILLLGRSGVIASHPQSAEWEMAMFLLAGSGATSRLDRLAAREPGVFSAIGGALRLGRRADGSALVYAVTSPEAVCRAKQLLLSEIEALRTELLPVEELEAARRALVRDHCFSMSSGEGILRSRLDALQDGLESPDTKEFTEELARVDPEAFRQAAAELFDPQRFVMLLVDGGAPDSSCTCPEAWQAFEGLGRSIDEKP